MHFKALIIAALSFTSICSASMHKEEKYVNKSVRINLEDLTFQEDGMFFVKDASHAIRITKLLNEKGDYFAVWKIDFVCGGCGRTYREHPGTCEACGSSDIREREIDLFPIG